MFNLYDIICSSAVEERQAIAWIQWLLAEASNFDKYFNSLTINKISISLYCLSC